MIETERLIIRPWRDDDRAVYVATCNTEAVTANLGGPASVEDIDAGLSRIRKSQGDNGFCFWALERKADGAFLGYCGLKVTNLPGTPVADDVEIGWRLRVDAWGEGYATEAAAAAGAGDRAALILETLTAFKRAGATGVLTYHAVDAARLIAG